MNIEHALYAILGGGILALLFAIVKTTWIFKQKVENDTLKEIVEIDKILIFLYKCNHIEVVKIWYKSLYMIIRLRIWKKYFMLIEKFIKDM